MGFGGGNLEQVRRRSPGSIPAVLRHPLLVNAMGKGVAHLMSLQRGSRRLYIAFLVGRAPIPKDPGSNPRGYNYSDYFKYDSSLPVSSSIVLLFIGDDVDDGTEQEVAFAEFRSDVCKLIRKALAVDKDVLQCGVVMV